VTRHNKAAHTAKPSLPQPHDLLRTCLTSQNRKLNDDIIPKRRRANFVLNKSQDTQIGSSGVWYRSRSCTTPYATWNLAAHTARARLPRRKL